MPTLIHLPALSPGMTEGKLVRWLKKEGDWIERGEVIAEIETDKSVLELESIETGRLARIIVPDDTSAIAVNTPLALLAKAGEDATTLAAAAPAAGMTASATTAFGATELVASGSAATGRTAGPSARIIASPLARRMAADSHVDLKDVAGSGPRGRIVKAVIARVLGDQPAAAPYTSLANSGARKITAQRLTEAASSIPHFYLTIDCRMDALLALREQLNAKAGAGEKLSINDFIIRACALALKQVPRVNSSWGEEAIRLRRDVDIAVAVVGTDGLVTPIVRKADTKSLATIAAEMKELAQRARARKLRPEQFQGGGFAISNLGMHGIRQFTAIINPPHVAILAVGAAEARPVVLERKLAIATMMTCTLSCDHRVLDGSTGAEFLNCFRELIAEPARLTQAGTFSQGNT
jgi:pyruvate dehydrogenase E2 component (dihydrolipoamide acetyltransferase)